MPTCPASPEEQLLLSALVADIGGNCCSSVWKISCHHGSARRVLTVLLRLAVLMHRGRSPQPLPDVVLRVKGRTLTLELPQRWMKEHPLTLEDLEQERAYLKEAGFRLITA